MRWAHVRRAVTNGYGPDAVSLCATPLYSNTTLVAALPTLALGGTLVLMRKFDATRYLALAQQHGATHTMLVPVQYQRLMACPDFDRTDLSRLQHKFCTSAPFSAALKAEVAAGRNPKDAKVMLAKEITARFHSAALADAAEQDFINRSKGGIPDDIPEVRLAGAPLGIGALLKQANLAPSTSEANRLIDGGGVRVDGVVVSDKGLKLEAGSYVVQVGKRKFARVTLA